MLANPILARPIHLAKTHLANPFLDLVCVIGAPKGGAQTQKKSGPEGCGPEGRAHMRQVLDFVQSLL